jgi:hypothetical protein
LEILGADSRRTAVNRRPADLKKLALPDHRQSRMRTINHRTARGPAYLPSLLAKKSFSTFNWPICR